MNFSLQILGAASAMPISEMNPSAQALTVQGRLLLIDCGEGTQQRMRQMHLSFLKVEAVFISHIHGDHIFGLFGVLSTMAMYNRTEALHIFGPEALGPVLKFYQSFWGEGTNYEIVFHKVDAKGVEEVYASKHVRVSAFPLKHKIECYGYRFDEICSARQLEKAPARSYAYCSDTMPFPELPEYVRGVDVLYHETTYPVEFADKAAARFHSTTEDAARCAAAAGAGRLLIGHYTSRVRDREIFARQAAAIFPNTVAVSDGDTFDL
ncbi:MAG: ribonuclease Z [Bacteroidales bacterium]|nr:ribonuclease Z [Bacteroidales bacterium]